MFACSSSFGQGALSKMYVHKWLDSLACFTKQPNNGCLSSQLSYALKGSHPWIAWFKEQTFMSEICSPKLLLITLRTLPSSSVLEFSRNSTPNLRCYLTEPTETKHLGGTYFPPNHEVNNWMATKLLQWWSANMKCIHMSRVLSREVTSCRLNSILSILQVIHVSSLLADEFVEGASFCGH